MSLRGSMIVLAALAFSTCSKSPTAPPPMTTPPPATTTNVSIVPGARTMTTTAYSPNPVSVAAGTTVAWTNNDTATHNAVADGASFNTPNIAPGGKASITFQTRGSFPYHCSIHPGMVGTVNVQ